MFCVREEQALGTDPIQVNCNYSMKDEPCTFAKTHASSTNGVAMICFHNSQ